MGNKTTSIFLDDILYNYTINYKILTPNDFKSMMLGLYEIVENKYKPQLYVGQSNKELKSIIDRMFNSWDLFVQRLKKDNYYLYDLVEKHSYKSMFMENVKLKEIYSKL